MMKENKILAGACCLVVLLGTVVFAAEGTMMENLTNTSDKIASINMNQNPSEAKIVLDNFFTSSLVKKETESSPVVLEQGSSRKDIVSQTRKSKRSLSGKVPPLTENKSSEQSSPGLPIFGISMLAGLLLVYRGTKPSGGSSSNQVNNSTGTQNSNQVTPSTGTTGGTNHYDVGISAPTADTGSNSGQFGQQNSHGTSGSGTSGSGPSNPHTQGQYNIDHNLQE